MTRDAQILCAVAGILMSAIAVTGATHMQAGVQATSPSPMPNQAFRLREPSTDLIRTYCVTCHNERLKTSGLVLDKLDAAGLPTDPAIAEKVLKKLRADTMPPVGVRRPDPATRAAFVSRLETALDTAAAADPNPGRPAAIHRLNRAEYVNVIRDVLALDIDGNALLPPDDTGYGFDNIGDVLTLSPSLLDRYLIAAEKISQLAVGDPRMALEVATYSIPRGLQQDDGRMSDDLPLGSRGGAAVRHTFPVDGDYEISLRLQRSVVRTGGVVSIRGFSEPAEIDLRIDGSRIKLFGFGGRRPAPATSRGALPPPQNDDNVLTVRVPVKAGPRLLGVSFDRKTTVPEGRGPSRQANGARELSGAKQALAQITITGPFNAQRPGGPTETRARQRIFVCYPRATKDESACARTILSTLARRAYRRPVAGKDLRALLRLYQGGRREADFDAGVRLGLQGILSDFDFLVRTEEDPANVPPGGIYRLTDLELASRLSFFLWSSIPDDELLALAERNMLKDPMVLVQQVQRMLRDPRASALVANFFGQWLTVRNVRSSRPDPYIFPEFDENLRDAFQRETALFLESQLREDRSVIELLTADYTFLNERLARHYGIPHVYGGHFRHVTYPHNRRAGLLGHGSVLMVTSYATRTSPVLRGKWILENILGSPPPSPPPDVPPFPEAEPGTAPPSVRARLEQHRKNPVCASCHARMDPLGFALENFDAVGKWRTRDGSSPIDVSGVFPTGETFVGHVEFRNVLVRHQEEFLHTVAEKLFTYAIGRKVDYHDMPAIRAILREAQSGGYRWSVLMTALVRSAPFQMRKVAGDTGLYARSGQ
jgi:mono/diheme cytochrome c family protein